MTLRGHAVPLSFSWKPVRHLLELSGLLAKETLLIDRACGAIESVLGQLGKLRGCRVVGVASNAADCRWAVDELGFDDCVDQSLHDWPDRLIIACPDGVDVYMAEPGQPMPLVLQGLLREGFRIPRCGLLSRQVARRHPQLERQGLLTRFNLSQQIYQFDCALSSVGPQGWPALGQGVDLQRRMAGEGAMPSQLAGGTPYQLAASARQFSPAKFLR